MYLNHVSHYLPQGEVPNEYFSEVNGLSDEWIVERTGIHIRRKAAEGENTQTMAIDAVKAGLPGLPYDPAEIDLIVGATYTPHDTIFTLGHSIQNHLDISDIPVLTVSTACSSLINAVEVVQGYFAMGKATKALVVVSEHNTAYNDETDTKAGHLWGDGAAALFISKERQHENDFEIRDVITGGAGNVGKAHDSVTLKPVVGGIIMPNGRDVFINACTYMSKVTEDIARRNEMTIEDIDFLIPHQANARITRKVAENLNLPEDKAVSNVQYLGNTGCAGCAIALSEKLPELKKGDRIVMTVFGGGYSYGAMLLLV